MTFGCAKGTDDVNDQIAAFALGLAWVGENITPAQVKGELDRKIALEEKAKKRTKYTQGAHLWSPKKATNEADDAERRLKDHCRLAYTFLY
jgi:hypothetical protein